MYVEANSEFILGYNIATHAQVFSFTSPDDPDGTGVISGGTYNGYIIANNNDGTVGLIDPTGTTQTIIASDGTRGDFTSPDTNDGSLLLSEYDFSYRLGPGRLIRRRHGPRTRHLDHARHRHRQPDGLRLATTEGGGGLVRRVTNRCRR